MKTQSAILYDLCTCPYVPYRTLIFTERNTNIYIALRNSIRTSNRI